MQHSSLHQQQKDLLASLFPQSATAMSGSEQPGARNGGHIGTSEPQGSADSSASAGSHSRRSLAMNTSTTRINTNTNTNTNTSYNNHSSSATSPIFASSSPMQPSSPNTQLTMQLLGNLMQGLDGGFSLPSSSVPLNSNTGGGGGDAGFDLNAMPNFSNPTQNVLSSSNTFMGAMPPSASLLEQQLKLQQLQQLHQLQNQIFQQQMALISGQSPVMSRGANVDVNQQFQHQSSSDQTHSSPYTGLPTPGPSTELRPQQQSTEFVSPMILNNYSMEAESSNTHSNHSQSQPHSHTPSPMMASTYHPHDDATFAQQRLPPPMASQDYNHMGNMHHGHGLHRGISSAPEHLAFDVRSGREFDLDVSPLTSPWLGAYGDNMRMSATPSHRQSTNSSRLSADEGRQSTGSGNGSGNKRTASPSTEESSARKRHSPAIGPTLGMFPPQSTARRQSASSGAIGGRGGKPAASTPLLRGSRNRSKSGVGMAMASSGLNVGSTPEDAMAGNQHPQHSIGGVSYMGHMGGLPEDSPSPVDLSGAPPFGQQQHGSNSEQGSDGFGTATGVARLTPVTPASIMNLGRLGMSNASSSSNALGGGGHSNIASASTSTSTAATPATTRSKTRSKPEGSTRGLKAILPAGDPNPNASSHSDANLPPGQKKTSHKAAEQKRRDSLKTTFDDLRKLLPPIAFEDAIEEEESAGNNGGSSILSSTNVKGNKDKDKVLPVRGPLLPGALPPRGPPKAGGDGPNKGVSKLQLLICGNQYIRTLKGRVERRDQEIKTLRREVGRLRRKVGRLQGIGEEEMNVDDGEDQDEEEEDIDLEKDLDSVEGMTVRIGLVAGMGGDEEEEED